MAEIEAQKLARKIHKEFDILKAQLQDAAQRGQERWVDDTLVQTQSLNPQGRGGGQASVGNLLTLPGFLTATVPPERLQQADRLFGAMDPGGKGSIDLGSFAASVHAWEPDFSIDAVVSTFKTCGAKKGVLTKEPYYRWISKVWASLSDERYNAAMNDLLHCVLDSTGRAPSTSIEEMIDPDQLGQIAELGDEDIWELYRELEADMEGVPPGSTLTPAGRRAVVKQQAEVMYGGR